MKILLTGASGLLGAHFLEVGLALDLEFKALSRKVSKRSYLSQVLENEKVQWLEVDLLDKESWPKSLFTEVDIIINAQGLASPFKEDKDKMHALNVEATKNLYQAAKEAGVKSWVQISSVSTLCDGSKDVVTEKDIGSFRATPYAQTKYDIDTWLDNQNEMELLTIHPCYMLGKWDARPSSGSLLLAMRMGKFTHFINGEKNFVSPKDIAIGTYKALNKKCQGHYVLGGENLKIKDFAERVIDKLNLEENNFSFYDQSEFENTEINDKEKLIVTEFCHASSVDYSKAKRDFNYTPEVNFNSQLEEAVQYFVEKRLLRIKK
jgi:dihydroflavonol-4-reductase